MIKSGSPDNGARLDFEAPADLSVGHVRIQNESGLVAEWVATPGNKSFSGELLTPGLYSAEITPAGLRPQTYVFEVMPDMANTVVAPTFSAMIAGANTGPIVSSLETLVARRAVEASSAVRETTLPLDLPEARGALRSAARLRTLSIGLCRETRAGQETWAPFNDAVNVQLVAPGIEIAVPCPDASGETWERRVRLVISVEKVKVQRLFLPLYRGGTTIGVTSSPLSTADVTLQVTPADARLRAIYRALDAGTPDIVHEVKERIVGDAGLQGFMTGPDEDPWAAMMCALLMIRFPETFGTAWVAHAEAIRTRYGWSYDAHVIYAKSLFANAPGDQAGREQAARAAVKAMAEALELGAPYYCHANQLTGEILNGLAALRGFDEKTVAQAKKLLNRWQRYLGVQSPAGASFAWLKHDPDPDPEPNAMMQPFTRSTGVLSRRHSRVVFRGQASLGKIVMETGGGTAPKRAAAQPSKSPPRLSYYADPPALRLPVQYPNDPNKGRFGGAASAGGFTLRASFEPTKSPKWARITLTVTREEPSSQDYDQKVWFYLHPSFHPHERMDTTFRGREASITVTSWGGFTVGVWLPEHGVSLECDLSLLPNAPRIIREY